MFKKLAPFLLLLAATPCLAADAGCAADAVAQARKLLLFHGNNDDRAGVEEKAKELPPLTNPANQRQKFSVFEVKGYIYKDNYRMRLIYYRSGGDCLLMGQEILELASL